MTTEHEAKFYPVDKEIIRHALRDVSAICTHPERQMRRTMATKEKYLQLPCDYIRVRDEGDVVRMSAKIHADPNGVLSDQKELDMIVSDYDAAVALMTIMGYEPNMYQETLRETWELGDTEIVIDTWPWLEPYIEIEAPSESRVREVAVSLGFDWETRRITSVIWIYADVYEITADEVKAKLSHLTFDHNPFSA